MRLSIGQKAVHWLELAEILKGWHLEYYKKEDSEDNKAVEFLQRLAEQGNAKAVRFLHNLAKHKRDAEAGFKLSVLYSKGQGVVKNEREAARLLGLAAAQGDKEAHIFEEAIILLYNLAIKTEGVREAIECLHKLANSKLNPVAQCCLSEMYSMGQGVLKDDIEARRLRAMRWAFPCLDI